MATIEPILRYPTEFKSKMCFVHFIAKKYKYSEGNSTKSQHDATKTGTEIAIYTPGSIVEKLDNRWEREDLLGGGADSFWEAAKVELGSAAKGFMGGKIANLVAATTGKALQPTDLLIFKGFNPIDLSLQFKLMPYSAQENANIAAIIKKFKESMIPSQPKNSDTSLLDYPEVWDITFSNEGAKWEKTNLGFENQNYGYHSMALKSCSISFNHGENFMVFTDDGRPVQWDLQLTFESIFRANQENYLDKKVMNNQSLKDSLDTPPAAPPAR